MWVLEQPARAAASYLGPACSVPVFILPSLCNHNLLTVLLAPCFECCSHKAMNKKDIGFNGLTKRRESFKKKQNKCIIAMLIFYVSFYGWCFGRLIMWHKTRIMASLKAQCCWNIPEGLWPKKYTEHTHCSPHKKGAVLSISATKDYSELSGSSSDRRYHQITLWTSL